MKKIGLLKAKMNPQGRREYSPQLLNRIHFIKRAQKMQFSLSEIGLLLELDQSAQFPKPEVRALVEDKLAEIDIRLNELNQLKQNLDDLLSACHVSHDNEQCPILEEMKNEQ